VLLTQQYNLTSRVTVTSQEKATLAGQDHDIRYPKQLEKSEAAVVT
jgi:hypothetical protein